MICLYKSQVLEISINKKVSKFFKKHAGLEGLFKDALIATFETREFYADILKLQGAANLYRCRFGSYRVIFSREKGRVTVLTAIDANNRGDIY